MIFFVLTAAAAFAQSPATPITPTAPATQPPATQPMPQPPATPMAPGAQPPAPTPAPDPAPAPTAAVSASTVIGGKDLASWLKEMKESPDGAVREAAVKVIYAYGAARIAALKPLIQQMSRETDPGVKINIVLLLGQIGAEKPDDIKAVVEALNSLLGSTGNGSPFRLHTIRSLMNYGYHAAVVLPLLKSHASDPAWETRQAVAMALGRIGQAPDAKKGPNKSALETLVDRIAKEDCAVVRLELAQSMFLLGPPLYQANVPGDYERTVKPYFDPLMKRLATETDPATKVWLTMVQMRYDGTAFSEATVMKIADFVGGKEPAGKVAALRALALLGQGQAPSTDKVKPAVPVMIGALRWTEPELVAEAIIALAALKTLAKDALPELEKIKAGTDEYLKQLAAAAIEIISGRRKDAVPAPAPDPKKK